MIIIWTSSKYPTDLWDFFGVGFNFNVIAGPPPSGHGSTPGQLMMHGVGIT